MSSQLFPRSSTHSGNRSSVIRTPIHIDRGLNTRTLKRVIYTYSYDTCIRKIVWPGFRVRTSQRSRSRQLKRNMMSATRKRKRTHDSEIFDELGDENRESALESPRCAFNLSNTLDMPYARPCTRTPGRGAAVRFCWACALLCLGEGLTHAPWCADYLSRTIQPIITSSHFAPSSSSSLTGTNKSYPRAYHNLLHNQLQWCFQVRPIWCSRYPQCEALHLYV